MRALLILSVCLMLSCVSRAQVTRTLSYQGVLTTGDNQPVEDGSYQFTFRLYDAVDASSAVWTEVQSVDTEWGTYGVVLGLIEPLTVVDFGNPVWLGITVDPDSEMPRQLLTSVPYARAPEPAPAAATSCAMEYQTRCGIDCVDLSADENHCGSCGFQCASGESCIDGTCQSSEVVP